MNIKTNHHRIRIPRRGLQYGFKVVDVKGESVMKHSLRRVLLGAAIAGSMVLIPGAGASAHVHGITPLLQCGVVPDNAGANQVDSTPAGAANGGPISGLIPATVGNSPLTGGDGGFSAPVQCP